MTKKGVILILILFFPVSRSMTLDFGLFGFGNKKNVILIVPDGCSSAMWASIRAVTVGVDSVLHIDTLPVQSRCRTYSANAMITDSAAAATAFATGVKTRNGVLGMSETTVRGDSLSGKPVASILEMAKEAGYATGIVTTASVQHSTPAGFYAHRAEKEWYELISHDIVESGIDVIMGGGREYMIPLGTLDEEGMSSRRTDNRNIINELKAEGYTYVPDSRTFETIDSEKTDKILCIFNSGHMNYEYDRMHDTDGEPSLWEMTAKALDILSIKRKGFFLLIEAARIDHAAHDHDTTRFLWEGIACDKAVGVAQEFARKYENTLLIVVSDHGTGGPHLVGLYEIAGDDSTVISYNQAGFPSYRLTADGFPIDNSGKPVAIQWVEWTGHTGEDVGLQAMGPGSEKLCGLVQNTDIFAVMANQLHIDITQKKVKDLSELIDF